MPSHATNHQASSGYPSNHQASSSHASNHPAARSGTSSASYPRDLIGYGRNPPQANWPGKAKIALQFVLNYEEGGENHVLHGDPSSEQFLSEIIGEIGRAHV